MVNKSPQEMAELEAQGPAAVAEYYENEAKAVFGHAYRRDRAGRPIETGIGSPGNPHNENHYANILKYEGAEAEAAARARDAKLRQAR